MKVLHVISSMDPELGGVGQAVRTIILGLSNFNILNEVVSLDAPDASFTKKDNFVIHCLGPRKGPWYYSKHLIPWLNSNLNKYDIVIVHGLWLFHGYAVNKVIKQFKNDKNNSTVPKLLVMPHGMLDPYFQKASGRKLKALRNWAYWRLIENKLVNHANCLLFTCEAERLLASESFMPYYPKQEVVTGLGVDSPPTFAIAMKEAFLTKCPGARDSRYLLFLSRIHEKKGVDILIEAYSELLREALKNSKAKDDRFPKLIIAGPGMDSDFGKSIKKQLTHLPHLDRYVLFPGMLTGDVKWGAFYGCEAFILPSHQENFGIAVVEALACGKPVLISNKVNIWHEINNCGGGIVDEDDIPGTKNLLSKWLTIPDHERNQINERTLVTYKTYFTIESITQKFLEILK